MVILLLSQMGTGGIPGYMFAYAIGARPYGFGRAFTGLADDAEAVYFNPGALAFLQRVNATAGYFQLPISDFTYYYAAFTFPTATFGSFGITVMQLQNPTRDQGAIFFDSVQCTRFEGYVCTDSTFAYADFPKSGNNDRTPFNAGLIAYSKSFSRYISVGAALELVYHRVYNSSPSSAGIMVGMMFIPNQYFSLGIVGQHFIPPKESYLITSQTYPQVWRFGIGLRPFNWINLVVDGAYSTFYNGFKFYGGAEARLLSFLYVRGGINYEEVSGGGSFEFTIRDIIFRLDGAYAFNYASNGVYKDYMQFSGVIKFGGYRVWADADPKLISPTEGEANIAFVYLHTFPRQDVESWEFIIKKQTGEVVRTFYGEGEPPVRIEWDGRDDAGRIVPPGNYNYHYRVIDSGGEVYERAGYLVTVKRVEVW
ncbi:MAG: FlgD immunoglobulin-like domain containing protein [candidate division WOR-3 bacterium]